MPLTPSPTLLQAIKALYKTMAGMPELWLDQVPEGTPNAGTYPQCVLVHGGEVPRGDSWDEVNGNASVNDATWDFFLFAENDSDAVETLALNLMSTFKPDALLVSFDPDLRCFRTGYVVSRASDRSTAAKPIYRARISYRAQFGTDY